MCTIKSKVSSSHWFPGTGGGRGAEKGSTVPLEGGLYGTLGPPDPRN